MITKLCSRHRLISHSKFRICALFIKMSEYSDNSCCIPIIYVHVENLLMSCVTIINIIIQYFIVKKKLTVKKSRIMKA